MRKKQDVHVGWNAECSWKRKWQELRLEMQDGLVNEEN